MSDSRPNLFYISVHSDAKVYTAPYKRVIAQHALYTQPARGRKSGKTCLASHVIHKISEALMDCGAVPVYSGPERKRYSFKPAAFFVTQLDSYWEAAIADLAKVGVRIYVLPVMGAIEGMPDAVEDSFNAYYTAKLERYLQIAQKGSDIRDLLEVTLAMAQLFEVAGVTLTSKHLEILAQIKAIYADLSPVAPAATAPTLEAALEEPSEPSEPAEETKLTLTDATVEDDF